MNPARTTPKTFQAQKLNWHFDTPPGEKSDQEAEEPNNQGELELPLLPDQPTIQIVDCELIEINTGEVARMAQALSEVSGQPLDSAEVQEKAVELYRRMRRQEAERFNDRSVVEQWCEAVSGALSVVARRTVQLMTTPGVRMDKGLIGDIKKRINTRKKRTLGAVDRDVENLRRHYNWLKNLENQLSQEGLPSWLQ